MEMSETLAEWLATTCEEITTQVVDDVICEVGRRSGRHRERDAGALARSSVRRRIDRTLQAESPEIIFQPIVHLESGSFIAHEAVVAFGSTGATQIATDSTISLRDDLELGSLRTILHQLDQAPRATAVCVDVSPELLGDARLLELVSQFPCHRLVMDLHQRSEWTALGSTRSQIDELRRHGVRIAIDGIGTGARSLVRLRALEPEMLKIDVSPTQRLGRDPERTGLVREVVRAARGFGAFVVAEGIESSEQISVAQTLGVDAGQGPLLGASTSLR